MGQRSTSALSHSQWPQKILQKVLCLRLHYLVSLSCFLNQFWDDNSRKQYRGHWRYFVTSFIQRSHWLIRTYGILNFESFCSHNWLHLKFIVSALFMKYLSKHSTQHSTLTFNIQHSNWVCYWKSMYVNPQGMHAWRNGKKYLYIWQSFLEPPQN